MDEGGHLRGEARYTSGLMNAPPRFRLALAAALLMSVSVAGARDDADNPNRPTDLTPAERGVLADPETPVRDQLEPLPAFPRASDLIPVRGDTGDLDYTYYIDVNSVKLTTDEVLHYTIVIQSPSGSSNIIYEGIRCATKEVKTYAFGTRDGRFARMKKPEWTYTYTRGPLGYRTMLVELYVCDANGWAVDADTVLERLVRHDPRRARVAPREAPAGN